MVSWRNSPGVWAAIGVVATLVLALMVVIVLLRTDGAKAVSDNAALVGALVALGGVFTAQMVSIALDDRRTQEARDLEDERTRKARDLEAQRAGEAALQNYFEDVGELLIEKRLRRASPSDDLSTVVRAQTLSVLEGLDPDRKRILLLFLYESRLIHKWDLVVSLVAANLSEANLSEVNLVGANLVAPDLGYANLREADLSYANLREADLHNTNLSHADLSHTNLIRANLSEADLIRADLIEADLSYANLSGANLSEADLRYANLSGASLIGAVGLTDEQIAAAESLEDATMPNGQKYEDWIKDKEGSGKDVESE